MKRPILDFDVQVSGLHATSLGFFFSLTPAERKRALELARSTIHSMKGGATGAVVAGAGAAIIMTACEAAAKRRDS